MQARRNNKLATEQNSYPSQSRATTEVVYPPYVHRKNPTRGGIQVDFYMYFDGLSHCAPHVPKRAVELSFSASGEIVGSNVSYVGQHLYAVLRKRRLGLFEQL